MENIAFPKKRLTVDDENRRGKGKDWIGLVFQISLTHFHTLNVSNVFDREIDTCYNTSLGVERFKVLVLTLVILSHHHEKRKVHIIISLIIIVGFY